jgi:large subunit ribosomal protein L24
MIRKGDTVIVNTGKENKKTGKVLKVIEGGKRVIVEKINTVKKHSKPSQKNPAGGIVEKEAPLSISNVQIFCSSCNKAVWTGYKVVKDKKVRYCKKCEKNI